MVLPSEFTIADDFPAISYQQWRSLVEEDLKGAPFEKKLVTHTYEGIDIQPVYSRPDASNGQDPNGLPGNKPFVRGSQAPEVAIRGADLRQEYAHPDVTETNKQILADLAGGVSSIQLHFDQAGSNGFDPDEKEFDELLAANGVMAYSCDDLETALKEVQLDKVGVSLEAGAAFLPAASLLVALWQQRSIDLAEVHGAFNSDPLASLARDGHLPLSLETSLKSLGDLAHWTAQNCPQVIAVGVNTSPYHCAGATAAQDLAIQMATGVTYLRAMTSAGMSIDHAAKQILFRVELGTHHFLAIAKLRAARRLWSRVVEASGGSSEAGAMKIHARTSNRVLTHRDPYVNILRNTVAMFAASIGGANVVTSVPFDSLLRLPNAFSRRVARNTLLIIQEEAHLHRVIDPGGGSWFLDSITDQLAKEAWEIFQEIERREGMASALLSGWVAEQIATAHAPRATDIAKRKEGITGVSEFPDIAESPLETVLPDLSAVRQAAVQRTKNTRKGIDLAKDMSTGGSRMAAAVEAAANGATIGQLARMTGFHTASIEFKAIEARSFAQPFEELRDAVDAWETRHGQRPAVFLANMGPVAHHTARASYAKNFFEAGGFKVFSNEGYPNADSAAKALAESGAATAVICSSDKLYQEMVPEVAAKLKQAGAKSVVLAGNPGTNETEWRSAGVDRFIYIKCNVLETLRDLLREEGVLE
ncbi:methylmalonyl-CoA mutase subunit beta [Bythopirellula polymerisocia]|uniref:Methylmalonyl-CoA mutase small subunit n=1 Tax=Bythopirellula polymerisocia TaxID=2528003 RepID=A0A5C6D1Y4_9BACT|nr:methylmalonyl-CoA mutase subunit beta [Bythopirellula polymerisocia]TWU29781.1 Methylmalonyl-CoA mutase small subunit [Bythopirellula polymerisocia]